MKRISNKDYFEMSIKSIIRKIRSSSLHISGWNKGGHLPAISILLILIVTACGILTACTNTKPADTSKTSINQITEASVPDKETTAAATPMPTEIPAVKYTFDLAENDDKEPAYQLAYLANADGAVIFGGETSPYYIKGAFRYSNIDSMWSPMTSFTFHLTEAVNDYAYSLDKTSIAFLVDKEGTKGFTLMYFDGSEAYEISPDSGYFCISSDGSAVAYISDGSLFVWDYSTKESTLITDDATSSFALSPSGEHISYSTGKDYSCYTAPVGGEPVLIGASCYPTALTDDGSIIYYYDNSGKNTKFCAYCSGSPQVLDEAAVVEKTEYMYTADPVFNWDCTQVVFHSGNSYYFSMNGEKPVEATGGDVVDTNPKYYTDDSFVRLMNVKGQTISPYFVDNKNLCNLLFRYGTTLTFFDENLEVYSFPIGEYAEGYLSDGGKALLYGTYDLNVSPNKTTYTFISDFSDLGCSRTVLDDQYIWSALLSSNDNIYYRNDIEQLYMIRGSAEPVKIDTYVYDINSMVVGDTSYVYYLKDQLEDSSYTLCCIEDVPGAKPVVIDKGVYDMDICDAGLVYYKNKIYSFPDYTTVSVYFSADSLHSEYVFRLISVM